MMCEFSGSDYDEDEDLRCGSPDTSNAGCLVFFMSLFVSSAIVLATGLMTNYFVTKQWQKACVEHGAATIDPTSGEFNWSVERK